MNQPEHSRSAPTLPPTVTTSSVSQITTILTTPNKTTSTTTTPTTRPTITRKSSGSMACTDIEHAHTRFTPTGSMTSADYEKSLGARFNLNLSKEDLQRFDHYVGVQRTFLVSFVNRWVNKCTDRCKAMQVLGFDAFITNSKSKLAEIKKVKFKVLEEIVVEILCRGDSKSPVASKSSPSSILPNITQTASAAVSTNDGSLTVKLPLISPRSEGRISPTPTPTPTPNPITKKVGHTSTDLKSHLPPPKRTAKEVNQIKEFLKMSRISGKTFNLSEEQLHDLATELTAQRLVKNDLVFIHGDTGNAFYWLLDGSVKLYAATSAAKEIALRHDFRDDPAKFMQQDFITGKVLGAEIVTLKSGTGFGELSLLDRSIPRSLSCVIASPTVLCSVSPDCYDRTFKSMHSEKQEQQLKLQSMSSLKIFENWRPSTITHLTYNMQMVTLPFSVKPVVYGERAEEVFIIVHGEIRLTTRIEIPSSNPLAPESTFKDLELTSVGRGGFIGDIEAIHNEEKYSVTGKVVSSDALLAVFTRVDFNNFLLGAPDETGRKLREGALAVKGFREVRIKEAIDAAVVKVQAKVKDGDALSFGNTTTRSNGIGKEVETNGTVNKLKARAQRRSMDSQTTNHHAVIESQRSRGERGSLDRRPVNWEPNKIVRRNSDFSNLDHILGQQAALTHSAHPAIGGGRSFANLDNVHGSNGRHLRKSFDPYSIPGIQQQILNEHERKAAEKNKGVGDGIEAVVLPGGGGNDGLQNYSSSSQTRSLRQSFGEFSASNSLRSGVAAASASATVGGAGGGRKGFSNATLIKLT